MRVISFGDLHLDSAFSAYGIKESSVRREKLRQIFSNIIILAKKSNSDIMLICGDLFDTTAPSEESISIVKKGLSTLGIPVFISPGNHDFYTDDCVYSKLPKNVFVFKNESLESVYLEKQNLRVDGYAFTSDSFEKNPLKNYQSFNDGSTRILCAHTDMTQGSKYAPFSAEDLKNTDYALAALGHIHSNKEHLKAGKCTAVYSGVIQGRGPDEPINGKINIIDIENGIISEISGYDLSLWDNLIYQVSADNASADIEIIDRVVSELKASDIGEDDIIRIELTGEYDCYYSPNIRFIENEIKKALNNDEITVKNRASAILNREMFLSDPSVVGVLYRTLFENDEYVNAYPEDMRIRAFRLALRSLTGNDVNPEDI